MSDVRITNGLVRYFTFGAAYAITTTTNQSSNGIYKESPWSAFHAWVTGTGAVTATINFYGSNDDATMAGVNSNWIKTAIATITLSGTSPQGDGAVFVGPYKYVQAVVSNVTGTGATVTVTMGV